MVAVTTSPVPPIARLGDVLDITFVYAFGRLLPSWSEMRDSNPRHPAPKAGALPTALIPGLIFGNFIGVLIQESH